MIFGRRQLTLGSSDHGDHSIACDPDCRNRFGRALQIVQIEMWRDRIFTAWRRLGPTSPLNTANVSPLTLDRGSNQFSNERGFAQEIKLVISIPPKAGSGLPEIHRNLAFSSQTAMSLWPEGLSRGNLWAKQVSVERLEVHYPNVLATGPGFYLKIDRLRQGVPF
jgi:hypothetical protein